MKCLALAACAATMLTPIAAHAEAAKDAAPAAAPLLQAQTGEASAQVGEVIVTAEKRGESLQRVPAAVTAVSGAALAAVGVTDQSQLNKVAPGLVIGAQTGFAIVFLRGVGQTQAAPNNPAAVALQVNGVYLPPESGFTPLYDMERVEVLPGPQGTLYGFGAAGGAINFITKKPTRDYSTDFDIEAGNYYAIKWTAAVNIPLPDGFGLRLAGIRQVHDGYLSNGLNDQAMWSGRATASYDQDGPFTGVVTFQHDHHGGTGNTPIVYTGNAPNPYYPDPSNILKTNIPNYGQNYRFDSWSVAGEFNYKFNDNLELTYLPGFSRVQDRQDMAVFAGILIPGTVFSHHVTQYTNELRLTGSIGRDDWIAGLYALRAPNHHLAAFTPIFGGTIIQNDQSSYAAFAEYHFRPTDALTLTLGGRYSVDRFKGLLYSSLPPYSTDNPQEVLPRDRRSRFDFKAGVKYQIARNSLLYGVIQSGYIPAGFDQNGALLHPSELTSYTAGSKNTFFNGLMTANLELFYYNYKDFQIQFNNGFLFGSESVPARIMGAELQWALRPGPNDTLSLGGLFQDAEMREQTGRYPRNRLTTTEMVSIYGYQLPDAPAITLQAGWNHTIPLPDDQRLVAQVNVFYSSHYWESFTHDLYTDQKAYTKTDASLTYYPRGDLWHIGAFVRNAENVVVISGSSKSQGPGMTGAPYLQAPRTYGVNFGASF